MQACRRQVDAGLFERIPDAPAELAADFCLPLGDGLQAGPNHDLAVAKSLDAEHFERLEDAVGEARLLLQLRGGITQNLNDAVTLPFGPYLDGDEPFPDRTHVNVLAARLVLETACNEATWADRAIQEVQQWETPAKPHDRASSLAELEAALASPPATRSTRPR